VVLERLPPVDEDYWNFLVKPRVGSTVFENVDFPEFERLNGAQFAQLGFDRIAQAASGFGEQHNFPHRCLKRF
jgi:hypothetical protein